MGDKKWGSDDWADFFLFPLKVFPAVIIFGFAFGAAFDALGPVGGTLYTAFTLFVGYQYLIGDKKRVSWLRDEGRLMLWVTILGVAGWVMMISRGG